MKRAVITGDIIRSRDKEPESWIKELKSVLVQYGEEPSAWEIFRGDSFQLMVEPSSALMAALHIKASMKCVSELDVRMAIGIGEVTHWSSRITESNGPAFIFSGECFDQLKKQTLALKTDHPETDKALNIMLKLALLTANSWTPKVATVIKTFIEHPDSNQNDIAQQLGISQSNTSEALKRGGFNEMIQLDGFYREKMAGL
ncbi:SatD family protein [Thermophagus sp. OGC60D27]|uniref:SatD family protein n=1 Tax=Thermophagus sp. OGC60D27 TaxID=3458415 RepID=UPI0040377A8E